MTDSFNLTTAPWIPCEFLDGRQAELSTRDTLVEAHRLRAIADPSPLVVAVLHRHLLAVLHRSYDGPKTMKEWRAIGRAGGFDAARIERYLERVRERMDLFHPTHPFAQTRGLVQQFPPDQIDGLTLERSSWGSAKELFQHRPVDYRASMHPREAARALLAHHAFATGGLVKKPNEPTSATAAPLVRAAVVLLRSESLFRTLISNLLVYNPAHNEPMIANENDAPAWERDPLPERMPLKREPKRLPDGWLDLLTWQSRRIELVSEEQKVVAFVRCVGQGLADGSPLEPMTTYRQDEKRGFLSVGIDPQKAFWRSAAALFEGAERAERRFQRPKAFARLSDHEVLEFLGPASVYGIDVLGLSAEKSRVNLARAEHLDATLGLFADPSAREAVEHVLRFAEAAVTSLKRALYAFAKDVLPLADGGGKEHQNDRWNLVRSLGAEPAAWSGLGGAFESFLRDLARDMDTARRAFEERTRQIVRQRFQQALSGAMSDGPAIRARAKAEAELEHALSRLGKTENGATDADHSQQEDEA